eukprot:PITA_26830
MAEERFTIACDLSSSSSSLSLSSPDSTDNSASSDDITDSCNSSWGFSPPPDGNGGPLFHLESLRDSLPPRKRGLSNFFTGKSQSFTSLADVKCAEDLAKPEKKLKSSHSWESTVKSSYKNQNFRSSILSVGSAESIKMPRKVSNGANRGKKGSRPVATNAFRPRKQII